MSSDPSVVFGGDAWRKPGEEVPGNISEDLDDELRCELGGDLQEAAIARLMTQPPRPNHPLGMIDANDEAGAFGDAGRLGNPDAMAATRAPTRTPMMFDGEALRRLRVARGLSLRELGDAVGLNPATISRIETANRDPKAVTVARIAKHLDLDIGGLELLLHE